MAEGAQTHCGELHSGPLRREFRLYAIGAQQKRTLHKLVEVATMLPCCRPGRLPKACGQTGVSWGCESASGLVRNGSWYLVVVLT